MLLSCSFHSKEIKILSILDVLMYHFLIFAPWWLLLLTCESLVTSTGCVFLAWELLNLIGRSSFSVSVSSWSCFCLNLSSVYEIKSWWYVWKSLWVVYTIQDSIACRCAQIFTSCSALLKKTIIYVLFVFIKKNKFMSCSLVQGWFFNLSSHVFNSYLLFHSHLTK